jgi:hypothetical protein
MLTARVAAVAGDTVWVRLDGRVKLLHSFFPARDDRAVEAALVGFLKIDLPTRSILSVKMATARATYGAEPFGVAIRSVN